MTSTVTSPTSTTTGGLGLSTLLHSATSATSTKSGTTSGTTTTKTASTQTTTSSLTNPPLTGCNSAIAAGGLCVYTQGATVTADPSNGAWVSLCNLQINGSGLDYSYVGANGNGPGVDISGNSGGPGAPPSDGCGADSTTATGNIAAALGPTAASLDPTNGLVADTCGLGLALDLNNLSTASVLCGAAPGLGATNVNQANLLAILGPSYAKLSPSLDLSADICGAAAAAGLDDSTTKASVFCETLSTAQNWQAAVPGTTVSLDDNFISADIQKSFVSANLTNNPGVTVHLCEVAAALGGNSLIDTPVDVFIPLGGTEPTVNCNKDANQNPIVSNGMVNLTVGDTGAGGGLNEGGGSGGTCGAGGGATQGGSGSTTNSCGTAPGSGPCTTSCNGAIASGNIAAVIGQNNAGAGATSSPTGGPGLNTNNCGGGGSGDPSGASASTDCGPPTTTSVQGNQCSATTNPPCPTPPKNKKPSGGVNAAAVSRLANTGFPLFSGLLGVILLAVGGIEFLRRREDKQSI